MNGKARELIARFMGARTSGQSIPIIALMIVALVGMVGLAVDVGNTYAEQRKVVSSANAAAIAGMDAYIRGGNGVSDSEIYNAIVQSLRSNRIEVSNELRSAEEGERSTRLKLNAYYLGPDGQPVTTGCTRVGCGGNAPQNVAYIRVEIEGEVDTFFARVVGQNTLPVDTTAYAGQCPASSGVYPITVSSEILDGDRFRDPGLSESGQPLFWEMGGKYRGYTARKIYVHENDVPGNFSWLRWMEQKDPNGFASKSENALQASLTGFGNLNLGFEEAPWPGGIPSPDVYPEKPGQLNVGDWVYGSTGAMNSNDIRALLDGHIANGTIMILPIHDMSALNGANGRYRVSRLGAFVLMEYGKDKGQPYLTLVFLGDAKGGMACNVAAVNPPTQNLTGMVEIWPEYRVAPTTRRPVQYVVILDVSGSMNYSFDGRGKHPNTGADVQCSNSPDPVANANRQQCNPNPDWAWRPLEERRIYVARQAILRLVDLLNIEGNAGYDNTRPPDQFMFITYNDTLRTTDGWSSKKSDISKWVLEKGRYKNNNYLTSGGTNGAAGLFRAAQRLQSAPTEVTHNGTKFQYKRAVIFVTDGVSNTFLDTTKTNLSGGFSGNQHTNYAPNYNTYPAGHICQEHRHIAEEPLCMTNDVGGRFKGMDRPISAMVTVSNSNLKPLADVYAVAMSAIPSVGLRDGVASFPSFYAEARTLVRDANGKTNLDKIFENINTQVEYGECVPQAENKWVSRVLSENASSDLPYPTVGEVFLTGGSSGATYRAPIRANGDGYLSYTFNNIVQDDYLLTAYVLYRHPRDVAGLDGLPLARQYQRIFMQEKTFDDGITVSVKPSQTFGGTIQQDLRLKMAADVCATR